MSDNLKEQSSLSDIDVGNLHPIEPGVVLGDLYEIRERLGQGGMGVVWLAYDRQGCRDVAIKTLPPALLSNKVEMKRVRQTFNLIHALSHQNICPIYGLMVDPDYGAYSVMRYISGIGLDEYVLRGGVDGRLPLKSVLKVLYPVAAALDYAHSQKRLHRDVKPSNIMLEKSDDEKSLKNIWLIDFGLTAEIKKSVTRVSQVRMDASGTYPYMAPEQWKGRLQAAETDQYALAAVAYELLSGRPPFDLPDPGMMRNVVLHEPVERLEDQLDFVNDALIRGLSKSSDDRFASCRSLIDHLAGRPEGAKTSTNAGQSSRDSVLGFDPTQPTASVAADRRATEVASSTQVTPQAAVHDPLATPQTHQAETVGFQNLRAVLIGSTVAIGLLVAGFIISGLFRDKPAPETSPDVAVETGADTTNATTTVPAAPVAQAAGWPFGETEAVRRQTEGANDAGVPVEIVNSIGMKLRFIPAGEFLMGSPEGETDHDTDEGPVCQVILTEPYYMGVHEVTQGEWEELMETTPWAGQDNAVQGPQFAASFISWLMVQEFCDKLSVQDGRSYRLPTEAEREYACRAGTETAYCFGDSPQKLGEYAWYEDNSRYGNETYAHEVGQKLGNAWGLHDMHGNLWEWCQDWYHEEYHKGPTLIDPLGSIPAPYHTLRGGSWSRESLSSRSANRNWSSKNIRNASVGFRVVCSVE